MNSIVSNSYYGMVRGQISMSIQILLVFYQFPMWFISLEMIEMCGLLLNKNIFDQVTM